MAGIKYEVYWRIASLLNLPSLVDTTAWSNVNQVVQLLISHPFTTVLPAQLQVCFPIQNGWFVDIDLRLVNWWWYECCWLMMHTMVKLRRRSRPPTGRRVAAQAVSLPPLPCSNADLSELHVLMVSYSWFLHSTVGLTSIIDILGVILVYS